jgi:hypothetical protein
MIELSEHLAAVDSRDAAPAGTQRTKYSPAKDGPFCCLMCPWYSSRLPD